ncbi:MAG: hypothetical protein LC650_00835 [Actinobacteria bacterium]|nr:hypothetical protein [Actinomycetota bacterium]
MRYHLSDVSDRQTFDDWRVESPWANHPIKNIKVILFTPGQGWLRFKGVLDYLPSHSYEEPPDPIFLMPPAYMAWIWVKSRIEWLVRLGGRVTEEYSVYEWPGEVHRTTYRIPYKQFVANWSDLRRDCVDPDWPEAFLYF